MDPVILIGVGEMGGVFARGFLKAGYPVVPVTRQMDFTSVAQTYPKVQAVTIAVAEKDLHSVLEKIPPVWKNALFLLQNELLPKDWQQHQIKNPTVISVWFEKKSGQDVKIVIPSPIFGPKASLIHASLEALKIPSFILKSEHDLTFELVLKNLYILTINIAGLKTGGTVEELWRNHQDFARAVASDVLDIQQTLIDGKLDRERLIEGMLKAFAGDWQHKCLGRTAQARLERAIQQADQKSLAVKTLRKIYNEK